MSNCGFDQFVRDHLDYNVENGDLTWKKKPARAAVVGANATRDNGNGYLQVTLKGKHCGAHRIAWFLIYGEWPSKTIDHINGNRSDNRPQNLREASYAENNRHVGLRRVNKSGAKGVHFHAHRKKYETAIWVDRKKISLGYYETVDEAAHAYNKAAVRFHGEFAVLNPVGIGKDERRLLAGSAKGEANG